MKYGFSKNSTVSTTSNSVEITKLTTDSVEFYNINEKQDSFHLILGIGETIVTEFIYFRTDLGKDFEAAIDTLFYVENKSKFIRAADLTVGDKLVCPTGDSIESVVTIPELVGTATAESTLYYLEYEHEENGYFINDVLVKNNPQII